MQNDVDKLTLSFLDKHPANAAQVLDALEVDDIVAFVSSIPVRIIIPVLEFMTPKVLALCFVKLTTEKQSLILQEQDLQVTLSILRHIEREKRDAILELIPTRLAVRIKLQLKYPIGTVGAMMNTSALSVSATHTVSKALDTVRHQPDSLDSIVFATDSTHRLKGFVEITALLRAQKTATIQQIMKPAIYSLAARASVNSIMNHPGWSHHELLPVVDRNNKIVGSLRHTELLNIPETPTTQSRTSFNYLATDVLQLYVRGWLSAFNLFLDRRP